jgi:Caudovirales tail fibre assembly protein.
MRYSASTGGWYLDDGFAPDDAKAGPSVDAIYEQYRNESSGKIIVADDDGYPQLVVPPPATQEQLSSSALSMRDDLLRAAALHVAPLKDAVDIGEATAAEEQQLLAWKKYRVALNRITEQPGFPTVIEWPDMPSP